MSISIDDLNTLKVAEIKDHLKRLDLPTQGFKKELVDRLKDGMESKGLKELLVEDENKEVAEELTPVPTAVSEEAAKDTVTPTAAVVDEPVVDVVISEEASEGPSAVEAPASATETVVESISVAVPEVELTLDEIKTKVLEHINESISRVEKFNDLEKLKRLTKDKQRIEKFGISEENPIAIELGLIKQKVKKQLPAKNGKKFNNRNRSAIKQKHHPYNKNRN